MIEQMSPIELVVFVIICYFIFSIWIVATATWFMNRAIDRINKRKK